MKSTYDAAIEKLTSQITGLEAELRTYKTQAAQRADELGAAILEGKNTAAMERDIAQADVRAKGLQAAVAKGRRDLLDLQQKQAEELQQAAKAEFDRDYQAVEQQILDDLTYIYRVYTNTPRWIRELKRLQELAEQYNLTAENGRARDLEYFWRGANPSQMIGNLETGFYGHWMWKKVTGK